MGNTQFFVKYPLLFGDTHVRSGALRVGLALFSLCILNHPEAAIAQQGKKKDSSVQPCPKVTARTTKEAVQMEAASQHIGCWSRDPQGNLVFLTNITPDHYKPLIRDSKATSVPLQAWSTSKEMKALGAVDIAGTWTITAGRRTTDPELALIRATMPQDIHVVEGVELVGVETQKVAFVKKGLNLYCGSAFDEKNFCLTKTGAISYQLTNPNPDPKEPCDFTSDGRQLRGKCVNKESGVGSLILGQR